MSRRRAGSVRALSSGVLFIPARQPARLRVSLRSGRRTLQHPEVLHEEQDDQERADEQTEEAHPLHEKLY
ncbi:MAG: hypothetical protein M0028_09430, partial [Clostridia bacterium]|nr:hypothetical protein [Clostridia bacterium]